MDAFEVPDPHELCPAALGRIASSHAAGLGAIDRRQRLR
jgi:hypothetical protein